MRIYLDSCALNRLTDSPSHLRIRQEAEAVERIFQFVQQGKIEWVASTWLKTELERNPDNTKRRDALLLLELADESWQPERQTRDRVRFLATLGYGRFDALHLAIAEVAQVDFLVTVDDRFLRRIGRGLGNPRITATNPIDLVKQVKP